MVQLALDQAIGRYKENEERVDKFVNQDGFYLTNEAVPRSVETLPAFLLRMHNRYISLAFKGDWVTSTGYIKNDLVKHSDGIVYVALADHTSGTFATDLAAKKWAVYQGLDSSLHLFKQAGVGAADRTVQDKVRETVSVEDFFLAVEADSTGMIKRAIASGAGVVKFMDKEYFTSEPLYHDGNQLWRGKGSSKTKVTKTTTTVGAGGNLARGGSIGDTYDKNAVVIFRHPDNGYTYHAGIEGIQIKSNGYIVEYGIYAPRMTQALLKDVYIFQCKYGFVTHDAWLNDFIKVIANCNSVDPAGVPAVAANSYGWAGAVGFWWKDDGSGGATGTSLNAIGCWARDCHVGWQFYGLQYSTLNSCAADNISSIPYRIHLSKLTMNSCATENAYIGGGGSYSIESSYVTMNTCQSQTQVGASGGTTGGLFISGSTVVLNACQFDDFETANSSFNVVIQSGSKVINNGSRLPANGNTYVSYSGGSQLVDTGSVPPKITSSASGGLTRYIQGRIRDNEVIEKSNKAVLSAGTVICTLTDTSADGGGVYMAAARLRVAWLDATFASGMGLSNVEVVVYRDGANYRQVINTSVNVGAGNGFTTPPTFTITRSGGIWSVTMTPAHGDVTCRTITAEVEAYSGVTVALP